MRTSHAIPAQTCPHCGKPLSVASNVPMSDPGGPEPNAITLCMECGEWCVFADDLSLRKPTDEEVIEIGRSLACTSARRAWMVVRQNAKIELVTPQEITERRVKLDALMGDFQGVLTKHENFLRTLGGMDAILQNVGAAFHVAVLYASVPEIKSGRATTKSVTDSLVSGINLSGRRMKLKTTKPA